MKLLYVVINEGTDAQRIAFARRLSGELNERDPRAVIDSCDAPLKHFVAAGLNEKYYDLPMDSPAAVIHGASISQFIERLAEHMREEYGSDVFGRMLAYRHLRLANAPHQVAQFVKYIIIPKLVCDDDALAFSRVHEVNSEWHASYAAGVVMNAYKVTK